MDSAVLFLLICGLLEGFCILVGTTINSILKDKEKSHDRQEDDEENGKRT